jgi:hypothetical protein
MHNRLVSAFAQLVDDRLGEARSLVGRNRDLHS